MSANESRYLNRELSWLQFNQRVLDEALDPNVPLLERLKFLAITASNLDEFFRVRVGGLQMLVNRGITSPDPAGLSPDQQLAQIANRVREMIGEQYRCYGEELEPQLAAAGISRILPTELDDSQHRFVRQLFESEIFSVLSPLAVTSQEDFPLLANQTLNVCVRLSPDPEDEERMSRFAVIPLGTATARLISVPIAEGWSYLMEEDAVAMFAEQFFADQKIEECVPFRITRNADIAIDEDAAADLLGQMEATLHRRMVADCVRLEISDTASPEMVRFLRRCLNIPERDLYRINGPIDLVAFFRLVERVGNQHLKYEPWPPQPSPDFPPDGDVFATIAEADRILIHPYQTFGPVVDFIEAAAEDDQVLAIKQTLYRTSKDSRIVHALLQAAKAGKNVTVVVELKARFDEARNIHWAKHLEEAGAQVIYGVQGLKTHAKVCIVVRREPQGIRRYVHFGTGNYNESTAKLYSDISLLSADPDLGADASSFFNAVTGYSQPQKYRKIEAAPLGLRDTILAMIENEAERKRQGQPARIVVKLNSLVDRKIIDALYDASQAGVKIRLNIRGICCLRPGVEGLSENIRVVSIVDRFLEHARVLLFQHGGDELVYISSADWMTRNLDKRLETLVPIDDQRCRNQILQTLEVYFDDNVKARRMMPDGSYEPVSSDNANPIRSQQVLYQGACAAVQRAEQQRRTVFKPYRSSETED